MTSDELEQSLTDMSRALEQQPRYEPRFEFELAFADDYEQLLAGQLDGNTRGASAVIDKAFDHGRMLLSAEAGAGKSSVTGRLLCHAIQDERPAIRIDLRRWTPVFDRTWKASVDSQFRRMGLLLASLTDAPFSEHALRRIAHHGALIVVDGLNEVPPTAIGAVLWTLDDFAARAPWAAVLVCDRLQRRALPSRHWQLATITNVDWPDATAPNGPDNALLLEITKRSDSGPYNQATILLGHIANYASLSATELRELGTAALGLYEGYKDGEGRFFEMGVFAGSVSDRVRRELLNCGLLFEEDGRAYFRHHLFHDALAAQAFAGDQTRWGGYWLDALTFQANSFDAVALALELLDSPEQADALVMAVYDWNLYAAAYAVSQGRRRQSIAVSPSTELALLAVLAERRWDPVAPSVQRVVDALLVSPSPIAPLLLAASNLDEVVALVRSYAAEVGADWVAIFTGDVDDAALVAALHSGPIPGWMAANTLRRKAFSATTRHAVMHALVSSNPTVRWRAAHTLGSDSSDAAVAGLLGVLDGDIAEWARYGAVRALVELAGHDETHRAPVLDALRERLEDLERDPLVFAELQRSLELRLPPLGWATDVAPLIEDLFMRANSVADQDHWRRVGRRITESVQHARDASASATR
jgi:hypothetical protein